MIPVCEPDLLGNEKTYVVDAIQSGWISGLGSYVDKFEKSFAEFCNVDHAISCTSGTSALHLALAALSIGSGDEVILPAHTMIATCNSVLYCNAKPVLIDSELETWNMDVTKIEEKITSDTKAIIVVHTYGHPIDMDPVLDIAKDYDLYVIEDAAEAHGAHYKGKKVGSIGDVGCFSFYANKIVTTGEGGMVTTFDSRLAEKIRTLRDHAFSKEKHFWHRYIGFNYRMANLQAAVGCAQMERIEAFIEKKRTNARLYNKLLEGSYLILPPEQDWAYNVFWMYGLIVPPTVSRDLTMDGLKKKGIETRTFFIPMHQQPVYKRMGLFKGEKYQTADYLSEYGMYLPSSVKLTEEEIKYVAESVREELERSI